jgi:hypothetical protein
MRAGSARAAAAAVAVAVELPFADKSEAVRLAAELVVELDTFPAARPFGLEACTEATEVQVGDETACTEKAGVTIGVSSVKMVAVIIVVTDIVGGSVFSRGTAEASAVVRVSIDTAVTVRVLGGIIDVGLNVEVAPGTTWVVESPTANEDVCEPIFEILPRTEDLLQGVWCRNLTISKNESHILPLFRFIWIWLHDHIGAWLGRMPP